MIAVWLLFAYDPVVQAASTMDQNLRKVACYRIYVYRYAHHQAMPDWCRGWSN